jgi:hypothetical protein
MFGFAAQVGSLTTRIGERTMARKTTAPAIGNRRRQRLAAQQLNLFESRVATDLPNWPDLPKEVRQALIDLMMRLILEYARTTTALTIMGADHDR